MNKVQAFPVINESLRSPIPEVAFASDADIYPDQIEQLKNILYSDVQRAVDKVKDTQKRHDTIKAEAETIFRQPSVSYASQPRPESITLNETIRRTFKRYGENPAQKNGHFYQLAPKLSKVIKSLIKNIDVNAPSVTLKMAHDQWLTENNALLTPEEKTDISAGREQNKLRQIVLIEHIGCSYSDNDMNHRIAEQINALPDLCVSKITEGADPYLDISTIDLSKA